MRDAGPLLVRYEPGDLEFTALLLVARSLLVFVIIVSTASVVAFEGGMLRLRRGEERAIFSWRWKGIRELRLKLGVYDKVRYVWLGAGPVSANVPGTST